MVNGFIMSKATYSDINSYLWCSNHKRTLVLTIRSHVPQRTYWAPYFCNVRIQKKNPATSTVQGQEMGRHWRWRLLTHPLLILSPHLSSLQNPCSLLSLTTFYNGWVLRMRDKARRSSKAVDKKGKKRARIVKIWWNTNLSATHPINETSSHFVSGSSTSPLSCKPTIQTIHPYKRRQK